jgi:hypothetical protein
VSGASSAQSIAARINPDTVRAQIKHAIIFGITAGLYGERDHPQRRPGRANQLQSLPNAAHRSTGLAKLGPRRSFPQSPSDLAATGRRLRKLPIDPTAFEAAGVNGTVSRCVRSRGGSKLWTMWTSGFPLKLFRQLSPAGGIHVFSCRVLLCTTRCEINERHKCALTARSLLIDGERTHRAIARRYQFALSQVFTKTLWPAIFPQGTYRVQCHCPPCRARSRRPEGRIISAEFVPVVLSRRDASRVGCPCDADQIELDAQLFPPPT